MFVETYFGMFKKGTIILMEINSHKLSGLELVEYLENHRQEFNGNGDEICMAAGYGVESDDGSLKCNFKAFVQALFDAKKL